MWSDVQDLTANLAIEFMAQVKNEQNLPRDIPIALASGGTCYAFSCQENTQKKDDWKADGYRWRHTGRTRVKVCNTVVRKTYFNVFSAPKIFTSSFRRIAYECDDYPHIVIVHYKGDSSVAGEFPHGNRRCDTKPYIRTCPSILSACKKADGEPSTVYHNMVKSATNEADCSLETLLSLPRDVMQVANVKKYMRKKRRQLSKEMQELHNGTTKEDFLFDIDCRVNMCVIAYREEYCRKIDLGLSKFQCSETITITCCLCSNLGNQSIYVLLFEHKDSVAIELMYYIMRSDVPLKLELLWEILTEKIPKLASLKHIVLEKNDNHTWINEKKFNINSLPFTPLMENIEMWNRNPCVAANDLQCTAKILHRLSLHYRNVTLINKRENNRATNKFTGLINLMQDAVALSCTPSTDEANIRKYFAEGRSTSKLRHNVIDLAQKIINQSAIEFKPESGIFLVTDDYCVRTVRLFPTEICHCNIPNPCHHIIAAKYVIGIPFPKPTAKRKVLHKNEGVGGSQCCKKIIIEIDQSEN